MHLKNKNIILGITGSIAAYKAAILTRLLIKEGANVKVIVTPLAKEFITPVTLATLSKNTVLCDFFEKNNGAWNSHIKLGLWADLMLIAPTTANTIAKMAYGIADNLLLTTYLSVQCPVMIVPAMDTNMYMHIATQSNIELLKQRGVYFIEPSSGELASGLIGKGRMQEPEKIVEQVVLFFNRKETFKGKKVLITAGPTHEYIDPIRYLANASSGKMGYAIAHAFAESGAEVNLISGPVNELIQHPNIKLTQVISAKEMLDACLNNFPKSDIIILSAAVADYRPTIKAKQKVKRKNTNIVIDFEPNPDIAEILGKQKKENQFVMGFALETNNTEENAKQKIEKKNLDLIALNTISEKHNPLGNDKNSIILIDKQNNKTHIPLKSKSELAYDILKYIEKKIHE